MEIIKAMKEDCTIFNNQKISFCDKQIPIDTDHMFMLGKINVQNT